MRSNKKPNIKILYTIGYPLGQGGHINSTYALIKEILKIKPNIKVYLLAPRGEKANYFKDLGIELISIKNYQNNFIFNLIMTFNLIVCSIKFRINTIHAMDYKSLKVVVIGNLILWNKLIFTKAGGKPLPTKLPMLSGLIVFSNELKTFYQNNFNLHQQEKINLIKERLDISELKIKQIDSFSNCFSIFIAMRLDNSKKTLLDNFFNEIKAVKLKNKIIKVIIAGDGPLMSFCSETAKIISNEFNQNIKFEFLGEINDKSQILQYYNRSNLVVGHGRGIMEAMAIGKPVVLLGFDTKGSQLISSFNIDNISNYNFSGRNFIFNDDDKSLVEILNSEFEAKYLIESGNFNKSYILNEYNITIGATKTLNVYDNARKHNQKYFINNTKWLINKKLILRSE
tara:strand:+ start:1053 stop:2246 length:1194 start_codon:yes stop_codon:yes gene_type:complete